MKGRRVATFLGLVTTPLGALSFGPGAQFQVNTDTVNVQAQPDLASAADGSFVVVWKNFDEEPDLASRFKIQGRLFGSDGSPAGPDFILDGEDPAGCYGGRTSFCRRDEPAVAVGPAGGFVVVWKSLGHFSYPVPSPYENAILGRRFASDGTPLASEIVIRPVGFGYDLGTPDVDLGAGGAFVVTWIEDSAYYGGEELDVFAKRFDATGAPLGAEFQVNTYTPGPQTRASVASAPDGGFVVVWQSQGSDGDDDSGMSIQARRYDATGTPLGSEFQVNSYTTGVQLRSAIGFDAEGDFVIVWESWGSPGGDSSTGSIQGQLFSSEGAPVNAQFQVNETISGQQGFPTVAVEPDGDFLVSWWSGGGVWARPFDSAGKPLGSELQINSAGVATPMSPAVAPAPGGEFIVAWESDVGSAGDYLDAIEARRLTADWLFVDGFETGDSSRWSSTAS